MRSLSETPMTVRRMIASLFGLWLLAGCGVVPIESEYPDTTGPRGPTSGEVLSSGGIFGPGGINLFGNNDGDSGGEGGAGIGINGFLWRASLDTLAFMPLASADPFGGVIITDWYSPPETPNERFKATVYILDRRLRADGVRVSVFRQLRNGAKQWDDVVVDSNTAVGVENAILTRARELRIAMIPTSGS